MARAIMQRQPPRESGLSPVRTDTNRMYQSLLTTQQERHFVTPAELMEATLVYRYSRLTAVKRCCRLLPFVIIWLEGNKMNAIKSSPAPPDCFF